MEILITVKYTAIKINYKFYNTYAFKKIKCNISQVYVGPLSFKNDICSTLFCQNSIYIYGKLAGNLLIKSQDLQRLDVLQPNVLKKQSNKYINQIKYCFFYRYLSTLFVKFCEPLETSKMYKDKYFYSCDFTKDPSVQQAPDP